MRCLLWIKVMRELSYGNMLLFGKYTFDFPDGKSSAVRKEIVRWPSNAGNQRWRRRRLGAR